ncbi:MAG: OmpA family protein [Chitinophagaceae bacterium]|nr:OmpA family protein [Chitinophagaceae bacterium]
MRKALFRQKNKLFEAEQALIRSGFRASSIGQFILADSFSRLKDSTATAAALMKVDPAHLIAYWEVQAIHPQTENLDYLSLNAADRKAYYSALSVELKKKRSAQYRAFSNMLEADQLQRSRMDTCRDSLQMYLLSRELALGDSVRAAALYSYVVKNGWPDINAGGLFAGILAIHDHPRHHFYFPKIKKMLIKGESDMELYRLMKYWISDGSSWEEVESVLKHNSKETFDISTLLSQQMPDAIPAILRSIRKFCPVKIYLQWDCKLEHGFYPNNMRELHRKSIVEGRQHIFTRFQNEIYQACSEEIDPGIWKVWAHPVESGEQKLWLHILAKNSIGVQEIKTPLENLFDDLSRALPTAQVRKEGDSVKVIYAELSTFELNSAVIKKSAYRTFEDFAYVLNLYGKTRFYIDGHTDNSGKPEWNEKLSTGRSVAAQVLLEKNGIDAERMTGRGFGPSFPVATNDTDPGRAANRRVEFVIYVPAD